MKGIRRSLSTRQIVLESVRLPVGIVKHTTKRRGTLKMNCNTVVYASSSMDGGETSRRLVEDADSVASAPQSSSSTTRSIKPKQYSVSFLEAMTFRGRRFFFQDDINRNFYLIGFTCQWWTHDGIMKCEREHCARLLVFCFRKRIGRCMKNNHTFVYQLHLHPKTMDAYNVNLTYK